MSKKHFIALADKVKMMRIAMLGGTFNVYYADRKTITIDRAMEIVTEELALFCQSQNSDFKRDRWLGYINGECGKNGGKL